MVKKTTRYLLYEQGAKNIGKGYIYQEWNYKKVDIKNIREMKDN